MSHMTSWVHLALCVFSLSACQSGDPQVNRRGETTSESSDAHRTDHAKRTSLQPDLSRLPAPIRQRLAEAEERAQTLEGQRARVHAQLDTLRAQRAQITAQVARAELESLIQREERRESGLNSSLKKLDELVTRVKVQALAEESRAAVEESATPPDADEELTRALRDAVEVYGELGEIESVQREAARGDMESQFKLARRYERGEGVEQSDVQALMWYEKAAAQDHVDAALATGFYYRRGKGTQRDLKAAIKWYQRAAKAGNLVAASNLANLIITSDRKEGLRWYAVAARGGVSSAQLKLAELYLEDIKGALVANEPERSTRVASRYGSVYKLLKRARASKRDVIRQAAEAQLATFVKRYRPAAAAQLKSELRWVKLPAGRFKLGDPERYPEASPLTEVSLSGFMLSAHEVTATDYDRCVAVGACRVPERSGAQCNGGKSKRKRHPINCVSWSQAREFARWIGGDLPSEAQWEFAARSAGQHTRTPWGDAPATCERAVIRDPNVKRGGESKRDAKRRARRGGKRDAKRDAKRNSNGCGRKGAWPVCSKPAGLSAHGLCDMIGNVWEWTLDEYRPNYTGVSPLGAARCATPSCDASSTQVELARVIRGGAYMTKESGATATMRAHADRPAPGIGFRVALSL